mgnify:CR=1 FL=1
MHWQVTHHLDHAIDVAADDTTVMRYVYRPDMPDDESPRPYLHPLRSLRGNLLTGDRPNDHAWHRGLSMTNAHLSGANFWGGPTYLPGEGYTRRDDHGRQLHQRWQSIRRHDRGVELVHDLIWQGPDRDDWMTEFRRLDAVALPDDGGWTLRWSMSLKNVTDRPLEFGSPTTQGRENAGYGGLFWRGPRDFAGGRVATPDGEIDHEQLMGEPADWLAYTGRHDGSHDRTTLVFVDHPDNPRHPNPWFIRGDATPMVCFALSFDTLYTLAPGDTLGLTYALVIAEGGPASAKPAELADAAFD